MAALTPPVRKLLEEPNLGHLATVMPDGSPQVTAVWLDTDGEHVLVNTSLGRQKPRNLEHDHRVALSITDRNNPYRSAMIRGEVVDTTSEGADAQLDRLAQKYLGQERYPFRQPGEQRIVLKIRPTRVHTQGMES